MTASRGFGQRCNAVISTGASSGRATQASTVISGLMQLWQPQVSPYSLHNQDDRCLVCDPGDHAGINSNVEVGADQ